MGLCRNLLLVSLIGASLAGSSIAARAQDDHTRGRKYKAPPETSHIEVEVMRSTNGKPISNAAVVFNVERQDGGKDEGNLEVKTGPDGKAAIDVIPIGSKIRVQVIADGFATFAEEYTVPGDSKEISIRMLRPRAQVSTYVDNTGKAADRKPGVQEPIRPKPATPPPAASSTPPASQPAPDSAAPPAKPNI
jgi:hypothetical protein